jgi:hypothetical protein
MMWAIVKRKLRGSRFATADDLSHAAAEAWDSVDQEVIDNLCSSFVARCRVCVDLRGESLNGHWRTVHRIHHEFDPANTPPEPTSVKE